MANPASAIITIADPGWYGERDVPVGDLSLGNRVNGGGRLSCRLPARTAHLLGWRDLLGRWIYVSMGRQGRWAGIIEDLPGDLASGIVELSAVSMDDMLFHVTTPRTYRAITSSPGALILRAITDTGRDTPLWLDSAVADEDGAPVKREWRGEILGSVIQGLANDAGGVWNVTIGDGATIDFAYRADYADERGAIVLREGYNVLAGSIRPSISRVVNDLLAIANDRDWQQAAGARVEAGQSVLDYGRRQDTRRYPGHTRRSSLEAVARADLARLALPSGTVSLEIPATASVLFDLQVGQRVCLVSATLNRTYDLAVSALAYEPARGTTTVVGTAVESA